MKTLMTMLPVFALFSCQPKAEESKVPAPEESARETAEAALDVSKPETLVGHPLAKVQAACDAAEVRHRVIEIDGEPQAVTRDYRPDRLNFTVEKGVVTAVSKG